MEKIVFNGIVFRKDKKQGYFKSHGGYAKERKAYLHREVWKKFTGEIPKGFQIHHKDGNKENNEIENLECLSSKEHAKRHPREYDLEHLQKIGELAKEWHKSKKGRAWHSIHGKQIWNKTVQQFSRN